MAVVTYSVWIEGLDTVAYDLDLTEALARFTNCVDSGLHNEVRVYASDITKPIAVYCYDTEESEVTIMDTAAIILALTNFATIKLASFQRMAQEGDRPTVYDGEREIYLDLRGQLVSIDSEPGLDWLTGRYQFKHKLHLDSYRKEHDDATAAYTLLGKATAAEDIAAEIERLRGVK